MDGVSAVAVAGVVVVVGLLVLFVGIVRGLDRDLWFEQRFDNWDNVH